MSNKLPLPFYKVLLLQLTRRMLSRVEDTGLQKNSKRNALLQEMQESCAQLEREFKRDVRLAESAELKREVYQEVFDEGGIPTWLLDVIFNSLIEEQQLLKKVGA